MSHPAPPASPAPIISTLVVDDPEMRDIVEEFVGRLGARVAELSAAFQKQDWNQLRTLAHQLKGAGGSYGYPEISALGATMEQAFKNHAADDFAQWIRQLSDLIAGARAGLNQ